MNLFALYARVCELSDPVRPALVAAKAAGDAAAELEEATLVSGAMRGEFQVMLRFSRARPIGASTMIPFLK